MPRARNPDVGHARRAKLVQVSWWWRQLPPYENPRELGLEERLAHDGYGPGAEPDGRAMQGDRVREPQARAPGRVGCSQKRGVAGLDELGLALPGDLHAGG